MKIGDIKNIKIARKYADALMESAVEENIADKIYNDLIFVSETINTNPELYNALFNPVVTFEDKKYITDKVFAVHINKMTVDFISLLIENGRLNALNEIVNRFIAKYNELHNIVNPVIISAVELNENQKNKIIEKLQYKLSKKVVPEYQINPAIIGGLVFEIGDRTIDCSIKTKFDNMKKQLTKGNSYGND